MISQGQRRDNLAYSFHPTSLLKEKPEKRAQKCVEVTDKRRRKRLEQLQKKKKGFLSKFTDWCCWANQVIDKEGYLNKAECRKRKKLLTGSRHVLKKKKIISICSKQFSPWKNKPSLESRERQKKSDIPKLQRMQNRKSLFSPIFRSNIFFLFCTSKPP